MLLLLLPQPAPHNDNHEGASGAANRKCESAKHIIIEKCSIFSPTGTFFLSSTYSHYHRQKEGKNGSHPWGLRGVRPQLIAFHMSAT